MTRTLKEIIIFSVILALTGLTSAALVEGWDAFAVSDSIPFSTDGSLNGWEVKTSAPSTNPYIGSDPNDFGDTAFFAHDGNTLRSASGNDYEIRHTVAGVDFGLDDPNIVAAGGIRTSFTYRCNWAPVDANYRVMMNLRGPVIDSPKFGINWDAVSSPAWTLRKADGTRIFGNAVDLSKASVSPTGIREAWIKVTMDYDGQFATVTARYLTGGSGSIDTGLKDIDVGLMSSADMAALNRMQVRTGGTSRSYIDDLSVDVIPTFGFYEDFESGFAVGPLPQNNWESKHGFSAIGATTASGEYVGGKAIVATASDDCETRHITGVDFNLEMIGDIEMGFDVINASRGFMNIRGSWPEASCRFGIDSDKWTIRTGFNGTGSYLYGNSLTGISGHWLRVSMVLTGPSYEYATIKAYDLTNSIEIDTGLSYINTLNPKTAAEIEGLNRVQFRLTGSASAKVDNAYVQDYTNTDVVAVGPTPADGEYPVANSGVILGWTSSPTVDSHKLYFGTDPVALAFETEIFAPDATSYALPYTLESGATYYWRVDEVVGATEYTGITWRFSVFIDSVDYPRNMAYEGFDYTPYYRLGRDGIGGYGWKSYWQRATGTWCFVITGSGSLVPVSGYLHGTTGVCIADDNSADFGARDAVRELTYPIDLRVDQDYYIGYIQSETNPVNNRADFGLFETKGVDYLFKSHMLPVGYGQAPDVPVFALRDNDGVWNTRTFGAPVNNTDYTVVIKIAASKTGDDVVSMKVYGDPANLTIPTSEPTVWDASFTVNSNDVYPWISWDSKGDIWEQAKLDEIRVGTGWGAVTGVTEACGDLGTIQYYDLNEDCNIDLQDYALLAEDWLSCTDPNTLGCVDVSESDPTLFTSLISSDLIVYQSNSPITIDGDLSDWSGKWYNTRFTGGYTSDNAADITDAKIALRWNKATPQVVYLALKVTDTEHNFMDNPTNWNQGDFIEFGFTVNETSASTTWWDSWTFDTAQFYGFWPQTNGSTFGVLGNVHNTPGYTDPATIGASYATGTNGDEVIYEMALPTYSVYPGTQVSLAHGDVVAINPQINSVSSAGFGALFDNQGKAPAADFFAFTVTDNLSFDIGDFGYFDADLDLDGEVGLSDLLTIAQKWTSCTDPEVLGCDQPWLP